jgi:hypothetical protein
VIGYFDTSAFVPLLVTEPGSAFCLSFWTDADAVVTTRLLYAEAAAALAHGARRGVLDRHGYREARQRMDTLWREFDVIEPDDGVIRRAADLADQLALRGYDAVHCASASCLEDSDVVVASGDRALLRACSELGMSTADTNNGGSAS